MLGCSLDVGSLNSSFWSSLGDDAAAWDDNVYIRYEMMFCFLLGTETVELLNLKFYIHSTLSFLNTFILHKGNTHA